MNIVEHLAAKESDTLVENKNSDKRSMNIRLNASVALCMLNVETGNCMLTSLLYQLEGDYIDVVFTACFCCPQVAKKSVIANLRLSCQYVLQTKCLSDHLTASETPAQTAEPETL